MEVYALCLYETQEIYLYSTRENAQNALIQRMVEAVKGKENLDFSGWSIRLCPIDTGYDIADF